MTKKKRSGYAEIEKRIHNKREVPDEIVDAFKNDRIAFVVWTDANDKLLTLLNTKYVIEDQRSEVACEMVDVLIKHNRMKMEADMGQGQGTGADSTNMSIVDVLKAMGMRVIALDPDDQEAILNELDKLDELDEALGYDPGVDPTKQGGGNA